MELQERIAIFQQFGRTYRAFMAAFETRVGQPLPRWRILLALYENELQAMPAAGVSPVRGAGESQGVPSLSQKRLVERLGVDPGALTRQLKQLEAMGWIERNADARDNRLTNVALTPAGRDAVELGLPRRNAFLANVLVELPDDALLVLKDALREMERSIARVGAAPADEARDAGQG